MVRVTTCTAAGEDIEDIDAQLEFMVRRILGE